MPIRSSYPFIFSILIGLTLVPASNSWAHQAGAERESAKRGFHQIVRMAYAMGGLRKILALQGERITTEGQRLEPEQGLRPGGEAIQLARYQLTLTQAYAAHASRADWAIETAYPQTAQWRYSEIIQGEQGAVIGRDTFIAGPEAPMLSTRLAARSKDQLLASPLALIHRALNNPGAIQGRRSERDTNKRLAVIEIPGWDQPLRLYIDRVSKLPTQLETLEDDTIYGDALLRVEYANWQRVNGILIPMQRRYYLQDRLINEAHVTQAELLTELDREQFNIPEALRAPFDAELFAWGVRSSQWFGRFLPAGIPFDIDQSQPQPVLEPIAEGIYRIPAALHNSMVVEMRDYLVVFEPPLYEQRTQAVLASIREQWPHKPIRYIIASHFHNDHIGGIRGYAAIGADLIVGAGTEDHYEQILNAAHTVYPDSLAKHPREVDIIGVDTDKPYIISDGKRRIALYDIPNSHALGMLMPYIEDAKLAFVSDLYNPDAFPVPLQPLFSFWAFDLADSLEKLGLDIQWLAGAHGGVVSYERFLADIAASR